VNAVYALVAVSLLAGLGLLGGEIAGLRPLFGVLIPYAAVVTFLCGVSGRVLVWARSPVPFRIPTTCGQQKSLPWITASRLENPSSTLGVLGRMTLEVCLFRSLFRNTRTELREGPRLVYGEEKLLWLAGLAFHWSFLFIVLRHLRFFMEPVPALVNALSSLDNFFQIGAPGLYVTDIVLAGGLGSLLLRRFTNPQVRSMSLFADYFALFLLLGLALSGVLMRYFVRIDTVAAKRLALGLVTFSPVVPTEVGPLFFVHLFLLCVLAAYFPFSKLMHAGGIFLSPTRNLANTSRMKRHINPWNYPVPVHTYEEWEDEFRDKIKAAGLPLEKE
jgi:nitrate reductase gamma subunit